METAIVVAAIGVVTQVAKVKVDAKYAALVALLLGVAYTYFASDVLLRGLELGLMSAGLYSGSKALLKK